MSSSAIDIKNFIAGLQDLDKYAKYNWEGSFQQYIDIVKERPEVTRNAFQRLYDLVMSYGIEEYVEFKKKIVSYNFFKDPFDNGKDAVFGLDVHLMKLVNVLKAAAQSYGPEKRVILLHGPVGSSKSTIARLMKKGLEFYSTTDEGALYTFRWVAGNGKLPEKILGAIGEIKCPMHEEPLKLIPQEFRKKFTEELNRGKKEGHRVQIEGDLDPSCNYIFNELLHFYKGDWTKVVDHIKVNRIMLSEKGRVGIGTFQPKDEKNQDSTELTGDINYRKIAEYGSDSDPRAFNFDGEFNIANRGIVEFSEVLKLDVAFLYDLLGASQEHRVKPKKFPQTDIDEVIIGHTNEPEYKKLQNNEFMEALRDRTVKIDVPYI
ncbi:MAG: serine protein kinase, partial [Deltaproteobacteria bacterium]